MSNVSVVTGKFVLTNSSTWGYAIVSHFAAFTCSNRWQASDWAASEQADHSARSADNPYPLTVPVKQSALRVIAMTTSSKQKAAKRRRLFEDDLKELRFISFA